MLLAVVVVHGFRQVCDAGRSHDAGPHVTALGPGSPGHLLGTDPLGHDVLGLIVMARAFGPDRAGGGGHCGALVGVTLGLASGYFGGWMEAVIMRWTDIQLSFPIYPAGAGRALAVRHRRAEPDPGAGPRWLDGFARVVRSQGARAKKQDLCDGRRGHGRSAQRVLSVTSCPAWRSSVIVLLTLNLSINILFEAALTFLGLGISPQTPHLGRHAERWAGLSEHGLVDLRHIPRPGDHVTALAINILGDWLPDR